MFEITPEDIAILSDTDLRALVGFLCETQMRKQGLPTAAVTWGGSQDAGDGGIDVRVALSKGKPIQGFVPKRSTGFQVKKPDMPPAQITKEMRPKGKLRPAIRKLASEGGAYIIVSSGASVSDSALKKRRDTMAKALKGVKGARNISLEYYDRRRLATWIQDHPGLIPWVRERIGKRVQGWQSYSAWAYPPEGVDAVYLVDDKAKIHTGKSADKEGLPIVVGIERMRDTIRLPRSVVRLVGLSGLGKTRLVQALFDERVGKRSLDPSLAVYTNMSDDPDPQPIGLASDLIIKGTRAILIVDNCTPELHRRLSEVCRRPGSAVSVITVEYDIRDDKPEETDVFKIESSSLVLIEKLIRGRFPPVSSVDAQTIAEFSGGNARIAIALAGTVDKNETLAGLTDADLFKRLFQQRHDYDADLLLIAQACSLVYSFQGDATEGEEAELPVIAELTEKTVSQVHTAVAELKRRDLVQQRGVWRAVLPHAIAHRLAKMALENFPMAKIEKHLAQTESVRLLKSFSRRLGYLHDSKEAVQIVDGWFRIGGLLGDLSTVDDLRRTILANVAPADPANVLAFLERTSPSALAGHDDIARLIRSIAYEAKYFDRCAELLAKIAEAAASPDVQNEASSCLQSLFYIVLSGTHATAVQRLQVLEALLRSGDPTRQALGLKALDAFFESWSFSSSYSFEFGAHSRDHGYSPRTGKEVQVWFSSGLMLIEKLDTAGLPIAGELRNLLARKFRGMWSKGGVYADLDRICRTIGGRGFWREGWAATRQTLKFDGKALPPKLRASLTALEKALRPAKLVENVRAIVLARSSNGLDLDDLDLDAKDDGITAHTRQEAIAASLGKDLAQSPKEFAELLPELVSGHGRLWALGRGLATGTADAEEIWKMLTGAYAATAAPHRSMHVLGGFINGLNESNAPLAETLLDQALANSVLGAAFPSLQSSIVINDRGVARLLKYVALGRSKANDFYGLVGGRATDPISGKDLQRVLLGIASKPNGVTVASEILYMRIHSDRDKRLSCAPELIEAGRALLQSVVFHNKDNALDHRLGTLVKVCFKDDDALPAFKAVCENFKKAVASYQAYAFKYDDLIASLFKARPVDALDAFLGGDAANQKLGVKIVGDGTRYSRNPIASVAPEQFIKWCDQNPAERYLAAAAVVPLFQTEGDMPPAEFSVSALGLLERAPDPVAFLKVFVHRFRPMSWSGSRAAIMESRLPLLLKLEGHADRRIADFAKQEGLRLTQEVERERQWETENDKDSDERFE